MLCDEDYRRRIVMTILVAGILSYSICEPIVALRHGLAAHLVLAVQQFRNLIVIPALMELPGEMFSVGAVELLVGTALVESRLQNVRQGLKYHGDNRGPSLGIYQILPKTHDDIWRNYLSRNPDIALLISPNGKRPHSDLMNDPIYATKIARIIYWRSNRHIPDVMPVDKMARLWKEVYNTRLGAGKVRDFVRIYNKYGRS
jgi:hypothetical protein